MTTPQPTTAIKYHLVYTENDFKPATIKAIRDLIKQQHFFKCNDTEKIALLKDLTYILCRIENIPNIKDLIIDSRISFICGCYTSDSTIILNKPSLVTFLHEFKHHINATTQQPQTENSARGYSHSLYYLATPKLFERAVKKGLLVFQSEI